jgi:poly(3-hydroxyalkanoate) synthetase
MGISLTLKNVKVPFLNVIAQKDDLVPPASSTALNDAVGSKDIIVFICPVPPITTVFMWVEEFICTQ